MAAWEASRPPHLRLRNFHVFSAAHARLVSTSVRTTSAPTRSRIKGKVTTEAENSNQFSQFPGGKSVFEAQKPTRVQTLNAEFPLNDSINALSVGSPGHENSIATSLSRARRLMSRDLSSDL